MKWCGWGFFLHNSFKKTKLKSCILQQVDVENQRGTAETPCRGTSEADLGFHDVSLPSAVQIK